MTKNKSNTVTSNVAFSDHLAATVTRGDQVVGFSESLRDGRAAAGDVQGNGTLDYSFTGRTSTGEQGTLETCSKLVQVLNSAEPAAVWAAPMLRMDIPHLDAQAVRLDGQAPTLDIQVVRAFADSAFWHQAHKNGHGQGVSVTPRDLAQQLRDAIELKVSRIPVQHRTELVLALNAIDSPIVAFDTVVDAFRIHHGSWTAAQGFSAVWLIGPMPGLTHRLA